MSLKHFINDPEKLVLDALESLTFANPTLQFLRSEKAILTTAHNGSKHVATISGGGAGHEPAHAAYVGRSMLTAAVSGSIFASPSVSQIYNTVKQAAGSAGALLIVKNYTGDIFNFSLAASKASSAGVPTEFVVVADDVSVGRAKGGRVGRRGLAGTVFVHKIASAFAASAAAPPLAEVRKLAQEVADNLVTAAASLDHVHVPGRRKDASDFLAENELELGMGIHNEPGIRKVSPVPELPDLVAELLKMVLDPNDADRAYVNFAAGSPAGVALMINNLGGLSVLELGGIATEVYKQLSANYGITPVRSYVGTYMTSLNGPGFSITLLQATNQMLEYLDIPVECAGWTPNTIAPASKTANPVPSSQRVIDAPPAAEAGPEVTSCNQWREPEIVATFRKALQNGCAKLIAAEPTITEYDTLVGDGDCGTTLKRGGEAISAYLTNPSTPADPLTNLLRIASLIEESMDGTSGAITAIYVHSLAAALRAASGSAAPPALGTATWSAAASAALTTLQSVTPARPGDRTLMDALTPFVETLARTQNIKEASKAARAGADGTKGMQAKLGRSVYVDSSAYDRVPDPGAVGLAEFFEGIAATL